MFLVMHRITTIRTKGITCGERERAKETHTGDEYVRREESDWLTNRQTDKCESRKEDEKEKCQSEWTMNVTDDIVGEC